MQENRKSTPKLTRNQRKYCPTSEVRGKCPLDSTLPSVCATTSRKTMVPSDIRRNNQSIVLSQLTQKKVNVEEKELELWLLYDEYLQTIMMDLIIKKKTEEKRNLMIAQLAAIAQEIDQDMKKLIEIKTRNCDTVNLSIAQKEIDTQLSVVTEYTKDKLFNTIKDIMFKLQSHLEPLQILQCDSIIFPNTPDKWKETLEVLTKCSNILKNISDLIGPKGKTYCNINDGLKTFAEINNEVETLQKRLEETLCNLQMVTLKNGSLSLIQTDC